MPVRSRPRPADVTAIAPSRSSNVAQWTLVGSLALAGGVHLAVGRQHDFTGLHGTFFAAAGILQAVAAVLVARRPTRPLIAVTAVGSAVLSGTWLLVRTPGLPGGDALDPLAIATVVAQLVSVALAVRVLARPTGACGRVPHFAAIGVVALAALGAVGFAGDGHSDHHHGSPTPVVAVAPPTEPPPEVPPTGDHHDGGDVAPHDR